MLSVTISPKYQIVIPRETREALHLKPGEKLHVLRYQNRIELVVVRNIKQMRGFLKGISTTIDRDEDRV
ncbi:MAG TPA: AbrB/MazE/SpoVT family DNA-binding domain-containing protein [Gammaproteobacteria bacterium]|jgi:AbrB family looped-hinge helix DNA binding protein|nr:AbrB/MazE/SpoVT family DNA-binding domain-containing protein [Gammaproteobacteria bacterium]